MLCKMKPQGLQAHRLVSLSKALPLPVRHRQRLAIQSRATPPKAPEEPPKVKDPVPKAKEGADKLEKVLDELKKTGMNQARAREVLSKWKELGVSDSEQLRKLLIKRSLQPVSVIGFQALLDGLACAGGIYSANLISQGDGSFPFQFPLQIAATFFGFYYSIQVLLNLSVISVLVLTAYRYGTNSAEVLLAVQSLAGPTSGLSVLDKAQLAVNTLKVLQTLEEISELLKDHVGDASGRNTLQNLSAYLTLSKARADYGFNPADFGLSDKEAGDVAYVFTTYDTNDDNKLELSELKNLCNQLGKELTEPELKEALRILDTSKNGYVEFNEFVAWWTKKLNAGTPAPS